MARSGNPVLMLVTVLLALLFVGEPLASIESADIPRDYTAVYKVLRNDKELAAVTISLSHQEDAWTLHGFSHDTRGFAKFLKIKGAQTTTGKWQNGRFRPDNYEFSFRLMGYKSSWQAIFDWHSGIVETRGKKGKSRLEINAMTDDPFSLSLNLRSRLAEYQSTGAANRVVEPRVVDVQVVDEGVIENQVYRFEPRVRIDSGLGCMDTALVKRVHKNEKRLSLGWYAQDHRFIPVRIQHKSPKGTNLELVIVSLEIQGTAVEPTAPCS